YSYTETVRGASLTSAAGLVGEFRQPRWELRRVELVPVRRGDHLQAEECGGEVAEIGADAARVHHDISEMGGADEVVGGGNRAIDLADRQLAPFADVNQRGCDRQPAIP